MHSVQGISQTLMAAHVGLSRFKTADMHHAAVTSILAGRWFTEDSGELEPYHPPPYMSHDGVRGASSGPIS
jgi:hypothetical protein